MHGGEPCVHYYYYSGYLEIDKKLRVPGCDVVHLNHIWSVYKLLQLSHTQTIHLAHLLLGHPRTVVIVVLKWARVSTKFLNVCLLFI